VPWQTNLPESASINFIRLNKFTHLLLQRTKNLFSSKIAYFWRML
jgi:hypothetical protein